jgi:hypothetical protein
MIRLTLRAQSQPEIHLFNKATILIGTELAEVDLPLKHLALQPIHLKIVEQTGFSVILNLTNDPFVTINGHPFGKKLLNSGDIIQIHEIDLLFEILTDPIQNTQQIEDESTSLNQILDRKIQSKDPSSIQNPISDNPSADLSSFLHLSIPFEQEIEAFSQHEWQPADLDHVLKEMETEKDLQTSTTPHTPERKVLQSLKDDYLRDLDDDGSQSFNHETQELSHLYQAWKWIILFIFSVLTIAGIIGTVIYFSVSDKAEAQETKIAQGMADIAMALMHAQLGHFKPPNQNWADIDFLKTNLQSILPHTHSYAADMDVQGQFKCCPYSLRIYTSNDLSHFLLIAQPAPSLLQWLIPKSVIVVDSQTMELRTVKDLRSLNRLLANANPLDGANGKEIETLIKQGHLIRLSSLANESGRLDFCPPKNLAWMKPGCENFIYNAPRYYRLGQPLVQKAIALFTSKGTSQEVANFKQEVESFSKLNGLILYADEGKKAALMTKQGFLTFAPTDNLLFGYIVFHSPTKTQQGHLLKDEDDLKEFSGMHFSPKEHEPLAFHPISEIKKEEFTLQVDETPLTDSNHPIYIQLNHFSRSRQEELKPLEIKLTEMLRQETQKPNPQFQIEFQEAFHAYEMINIKHTRMIKEALQALYHQYEDMPITTFLSLVKDAKLDQMIQSTEGTLGLVDENCQRNFELLLTYIESCKTLPELDNLIHLSSAWLTFDYIKDTKELMKYQNLLRNKVLYQLEKFLLSHQQKIPNQHVKQAEKEYLEHILNQERLIKPDEREFFLEEFERLFKEDEGMNLEKHPDAIAETDLMKKD